ncbi:nitroreductase family deazaflavin-dependent oxidoreductase [Actinokineospora sp. HUAS TT18]|uniref:nitroreductase family deazaflavin-dependent oxidoreductase n=1 Tax=Actinokineospora sp. HUAS TT18 TaxID=3447451 RepID=UPI003F51ECD0
MNPLTPVAKTIGKQPWLPKFAPAIVGLDRFLDKVSRGRLAILRIAGLPQLVLTVRGRKSGQPRSTPLLCVPHGRDYIIAGSNWGKPKPPVWSLNLVANPDATINVGGVEQAVVARVATGQERDDLWKVLLGTWPAYAAYAERTDREIKVFVLSPADSGR